MVFNPAPLIIASMNFARRMREQEKEKQLAEEEKEQWQQPKFKPLEGTQVEIYPYYVCKMIEQYKTEPDGQINFLEKVCKPKEVIKEYRMDNGKKIEKIF